jgi:hypothetical protein
MSDDHDYPGGIAGICFALCILMALIGGLMQTCAPAIPTDQGTATTLRKESTRRAIIYVAGEPELLEVRR